MYSWCFGFLLSNKLSIFLLTYPVFFVITRCRTHFSASEHRTLFVHFIWFHSKSVWIVSDRTIKKLKSDCYEWPRAFPQSHKFLFFQWEESTVPSARLLQLEYGSKQRLSKWWEIVWAVPRKGRVWGGCDVISGQGSRLPSLVSVVLTMENWGNS